MNENEMLSTSEMSRVQNALDGILVKLPYGSRLYGTDTETSDYDYKILYLPKLTDLLMGKRITNFKARFNEDGSVLTGEGAMPDRGYEMEFIALQTFMADWLQGQTYAVEMVFAIDSGFGEYNLEYADSLRLLVNTMVEEFNSGAVTGMVGFAIKQTFDYVHRGQRLNEAKYFLEQFELGAVLGTLVKGKVRLDSPMPDGRTIFQYVVDETAKTEFADSLTTRMVVNGVRDEMALCFGGRTYVISTPMSEMVTNMKAKVKSYGGRTTDASTKVVDPKSLMHAVRVYQQVIELLSTGRVAFPRPNRSELLSIRNLELPMEEIKQKLIDLDKDVVKLVDANPSHVNELFAAYQELTITYLGLFYGID